MRKQRLKAIGNTHCVDRKVLCKQGCIKGVDDVWLEEPRVQYRKINWAKLFYHSLNGLLRDRQIRDIERDGVDAARAVFRFVSKCFEFGYATCAGSDNPAF